MNTHSNRMDFLDDDFVSELPSLDDGMSLGDFDPDELFPCSPSQGALSVPATLETFRVHRTVSVDSMSKIRAAMQQQPISSTPYDTFKDLVLSKSAGSLKRTSSVDMDRGASVNATFALIQDNSDHSSSQPSLSRYLRHSLLGRNNNSANAQLLTSEIETNVPFGPTSSKRRKFEQYPLHHACLQARSLPLEIHQILKDAPSLASQTATIYTTRTVYNSLTHSLETNKRVKASSYQYALNVAIQNKAEAATIEALLLAAPQVATQRDGLAQESSLHVLLRHSVSDLQSVDFLLLRSPKTVSLLDKHDNTPLHVACAKGAPFDVIRHLCILYPEALTLKNFHGCTPLQIAQRSSRVVDESVVTHLQEKLVEHLRAF